MQKDSPYVETDPRRGERTFPLLVLVGLFFFMPLFEEANRNADLRQKDPL